MSSIHPMPDDSAVSQMLGMMFGDEVEIEPGNPVTENTVTAVFLNDADEPVCACVSDYNCAAFLGSALTKIPPGGAEDAAKSGDFSDMMVGNFRETMNICSRLLMNADSPHIRLHELYMSADNVPDDCKAMLDSAAASKSYTVTLPNYGSGTLSFVST
ncbi:MAG: hypothetical protein AB8C02_13375 [Halioglobus sp.]